MNGQDLYEGLRYVDPTLLEEAMEPVKRPKWMWNGWRITRMRTRR